MLRTVVSTGAVPVTWVAPQAENQRVVAVSIMELPAQLDADVAGVVLVGVTPLLLLEELLFEVLSDPQAVSTKARVSAGSVRDSFD